MPPPPRMRLTWISYEHDRIERGADWFWALGIAAVCLALIAVILHDVLFAILIITAAVTLALHARLAPELIQFELSDRGIRVGDTLHRYREILSFWVEEEGERPLLLVDTTKFMSPNLIIPLDTIDPHAVRHYLRQHAKEVHMREPIAHKILEFLGL